MIDEKDILYHYTTIAGLNDIICSKKIWASDCRYLNDRHELESAIEIFLNKFTDSDKKAITAAFYYHRLTNCHCIFSLSTSPTVLSQWRAYGDDGRGGAIGFDKNFLSLSYLEPQATLIECIYTDHDDFIENIIAKKSQEIKDIIKKYNSFQAENEFMEEIRKNPKSLNTLFTELLRIKNKAFAEEQEVRLVFHVPVGATKTRVNNGLIIPYIEYALCDGDVEKNNFWCMAPKIWLGPKSDERNLNAIRTFQQFGWTVQETVQRYDCGYL